MTGGTAIEMDGRRLDAASFHAEIVPRNRPVVLRGLVDGWPVVQAARRGDAALADYLRRFDPGEPLKVKVAPPETEGVFFYDETLTGMNFERRRMPLSAALDLLLELRGQDRPPAVAVQSKPVHQHLPGFAEDNPLPLVPAGNDMRVWIGNASTVGTHFDDVDNIACVVAGRRRFTLFPPEQVANLYQGPFELTPAVPVSMVHVDSPDFVRYPRFARALETAITVDLEPGDALYLPYLWWHGVRSLDPFNMLVNFWWSADAAVYGAPREALLHAMMSLKNLAPARRAAWRAMFDHFVFEDHGAPGEHLPPRHRGVQGAMTPVQAERIRARIVASLGGGDTRSRSVAVRLQSGAGSLLRRLGLRL